MSKSKTITKTAPKKKSAAKKPIAKEKNVEYINPTPGVLGEESQAWERGIEIPCEKVK